MALLPFLFLSGREGEVRSFPELPVAMAQPNLRRFHLFRNLQVSPLPEQEAEVLKNLQAATK
jgi:hypothetical protein